MRCRLDKRSLDGPWQTQFTRTPSAIWSSAIARVSCTTAPLEAAYAAAPRVPTRPRLEAMLMMLPPPPAIMCGNTYRETQEDAAHVGGRQRVPFVDPGVDNTAEIDDSSVVEQHVDAAEVLHDLCNH